MLSSLPATGGFLLLVIAESVGAPDVVRGISPFAHLAPVPLAAAEARASVAMLGMAVALTVVGVVGYRRRDWRG
nr:hypothetical protein GCM10020092_074610 [Actinoplanes digitatis]